MPADRVTSQSPWHVVLVLDDSDGMRGQVAAELNAMTQEVLAEMDVASKGLKPYFRVSALAYGDETTVLDEWKDPRQVDPERVASLNGSAGRPNLGRALSVAREILARYPGKSTDFRPYVFVFSGTKLDDDAAGALREASKLKRLKLPAGSPKVVVIALGPVDERALTGIASTPALCRRPQDLESFQRLFPPIGTVAGLSRNGEEKIDDIIMNL